MNHKSLKILVISFYFPPYNKVGGRRWAKHCKYLVKNSIETFVLSGTYTDTSPWDKDIETFRNKIYRIDNTVIKKPFYQTKLPQNFFEKIKWKLSYYIWEISKKKLTGNYNDPSVNNESKYFIKAKEIIENNKINTVLLSVGPFNYSSVLPQLKEQFPDVRYIIDYRDYWEDSLSGLSIEQVESEKKMQQDVVAAVDLVLSPNEEMQYYYKTKFNKMSFCLPHCYDDEDIKMDVKKTNNTSGKIMLIYGGAFYAEISENIFLIKELINKLTAIKKVEAEFYVSIKGYEKELEHPTIKRFDFMESEKYFEKVKDADYAILILPPNRVNAMSSKFYELVALRKPILYFGGIGEVSEFLIKHNLGFHITNENISQQVEVIIANIKNQLIPDLNYNIEAHSFDHQTKLFIEELEKL